MPVEYIGPFEEEYLILVDGYQVPYITATPNGNGVWTIHFDQRFSMTIGGDNASEFLWFLANAMAVAGGYTCFGTGSIPANPFSSKTHGVSFDEIDEWNKQIGGDDEIQA